MVFSACFWWAFGRRDRVSLIFSCGFLWLRSRKVNAPFLEGEPPPDPASPSLSSASVSSIPIFPLLRLKALAALSVVRALSQMILSPSPQFEPRECLLPVKPQGPADFSHYCKLLLLGALHLLLRCNQGFLTD